jgi:hypothetical protein
MPHVDDGTLHALLDGALRAEDPARADSVEAHLDSCPDCRALRDRAADLRAGAAGILATLEPDARPDFQEVLVRAGHGVAAAGAGSPEAAAPAALAGGRAGRLHGQARATRAVAWAATVVLALGTGYLIRDLVEPEAGFVAVQERSAAAVRVEPGAAGRPEADAADAIDPVEAPAMAPTTVPSTPPATPTPAAAAEVVPPAVAPAAGAPPVAARAAPEPTEAAPPTVALAEAEMLAAEPDVALDEVVVTAPTMAREPVLTRAAPGRQDAPAVVAHQMVEDAADRPTIRLRGATAVTGWRAITDADALALMDGPLYVLPGAVVDSIFARGQGQTAEVRSLQRLDGVVLLTVTQRRADGPDAAVYAEALAPKTEPAVGSARHERHWITVTGELPAETLRALAASASPLRDHGSAGPPR